MNRILNAIIMSFIASFGWFILGVAVEGGGIVFAFQFSLIIFSILFILFLILCLRIKDLNLLKDEKIKLKG